VAAAPKQARLFLAQLVVILTVLILISLYIDLHNTGDRYRDLAEEMGRSFYHAIDAMREWNLDHGGLYVSVAAKNWSTLAGWVEPRDQLSCGLV